jgi:hypothetical protein
MAIRFLVGKHIPLSVVRVCVNRRASAAKADLNESKIQFDEVGSIKTAGS